MKMRLRKKRSRKEGEETKRIEAERSRERRMKQERVQGIEVREAEVKAGRERRGLMVAAVGRRAGHEHRKRDEKEERAQQALMLAARLLSIQKGLWMKSLYQNLTMLIGNFVVEGLVLHRGLAVM